MAALDDVRIDFEILFEHLYVLVDVPIQSSYSRSKVDNIHWFDVVEQHTRVFDTSQVGFFG
jgi:hypothetical protein